MNTFYIETDKNGQVLHDFSFHLISAIAFHKWRYQEERYKIIFSKGKKMTKGKKWIPIGSIPFVLETLGNGGDKVTPLNVPDVLSKSVFTKRNLHKDKSLAELCQLPRPFFMKERLVYKGVTDIIEEGDSLSEYPPTRYDASEVVEITSEWRIFVHQDTIVGAKPYGSEKVVPMIPDESLLSAMVSTIEEYRLRGGHYPLSYTLDVGVNGNDGTFLIESHPFISCGLYGFSDYQLLPAMMIQGYRFLEQQTRLGAID